MENHQRAVSGFIAWTLTIIGFSMYLIWSLLPIEFLHSLRFTYYPDRYWGVALPAFVAVTFWYYWSTYFLMYLRNTKKLTSMLNLTDNNARGAKTALGTLAGESQLTTSIPPISDIPVTVTSSLFYEVWD